jgi:hypothetical protein
MFGHLRSLLLRREFSATKTKLRVRRPLHHGSLAARAPVVPLPRYRGDGKGRRSRDASASELDAGARRDWRNSSPFIAFTLCFSLPSQKKKGGGTPANAGHHRRILRCGTHPAGRARLSAFHHGSHLRELFHPKGSASGQASWDAVCTGVTRLRLSQSRDAPPTPVVMPGDMMPKPPGSRLQTRPRAPPSLP